jgi:hypothetical protein
MFLILSHIFPFSTNVCVCVFCRERESLGKSHICKFLDCTTAAILEEKKEVKRENNLNEKLCIVLRGSEI